MCRTYPQILDLEQLHQNFNVAIHVSHDEYLAENRAYPKVEFLLNGQSFSLYVDDEYQDLKLGNPLLDLCLVMREFEAYEDGGDYLKWCREHMFDSANQQIREYHMSLGKTYREVEKILGKIDSRISNYDFQLNAGAARELREG